MSLQQSSSYVVLYAGTKRTLRPLGFVPNPTVAARKVIKTEIKPLTRQESMFMIQIPKELLNPSLSHEVPSHYLKPIALLCTTLTLLL